MARLVSALLALLLVPGAARANISAPWTEGEPAADPIWDGLDGRPPQRGEPAGAPRGELRLLEIVRQELDLDLRPLAQGRAASVLVRYQIRNPGPARRWTMVFVTPGLKTGTVALDGAPLSSTRAEERELPDRWRSGLTTPSLTGGTAQVMLRRQATTLTFEFETGEGREHRIEVRYWLAAPERHRDEVYLTHQVVYLLAPARQWGRFGTLQVHATLPPGWRAAAAPALERRGDELHGTFQGLPGNTIAIATARPLGLAPHGWLLTLAGAILALGVTPLLSLWLGRRLARRGAALAVVGALGVGLFAAVALLALPMAGSLLWVDLLDASQLSQGYFYGWSMGLTVLGLPAALLWGVGNLILLLLWRRRARRRLA
jgi:hypothetical protein